MLISLNAISNRISKFKKNIRKAERQADKGSYSYNLLLSNQELFQFTTMF